MHPLRRKVALDAVNEELLKPGANEDPRADKEWQNPWASKGTEAMRSARRHQADIHVHKSPKHLPPRLDARSYLDDDVKAEMAADKAGEPTPIPRHALRQGKVHRG